jgi:hypothetical protein
MEAVTAATPYISFAQKVSALIDAGTIDQSGAGVLRDAADARLFAEADRAATEVEADLLLQSLVDHQRITRGAMTFLKTHLERIQPI